MQRRLFLDLVAASIICFITAAVALSPSKFVPLLGPSFISNFDPTNTGPIRDATKAFSGAIDALFEDGSLNQTDLVFAVDVFSAATNQSLYSYHHVGDSERVTLTSGELNDKTISKLGSVSKLFTVYAIIAKAGIEVFSDPVLKYIPELACNSTNFSSDSLTHIPWEDITVGALASHQAGVGGVARLLTGVGSNLFAPTPVDPFAITPRQLWEFMCTKYPVTSPFRTAVYSDGGFAVLGQVLARLTGKDYGEAIREILFEPLGLEGITGGLYASTSDLRAAGLSILNSKLISAATTQHWMKPLSGTGSLVEVVGAPWEIERLAIPTAAGSNYTRICDLYTKVGGNTDYNANFALSPDHGIGFSILVTGPSSEPARWSIRDAIGKLIIPAAEAAAAENAEATLAGTFVVEGSADTNLTISVDKQAPGLRLDSFYFQGVESSELLAYVPGGRVPAPLELRFFPTGTNSYSRSLSTQYKTDGTMKLAHRLVHSDQAPPLAPRPYSEGGTGGMFSDQHTWQDIDDEGADNFVFTIEKGRLITVENVDLHRTFKRVG
ncbi:hypothetical protein E8E14_000400 [Neopestalotiopsis sp. 37M]|nr:hypothetical protein E8E14_000400 [Neopestalotiopsis sp. 37M]